MKPTAREAAAARSLAESILELVVALEEGSAMRQEERSKKRAASQPPPVAPEPVVAVAPRPKPTPPPPEAKPATKATPDRLLVSIPEAAKYLSVSKRTVWRLASRGGEFPIVRIGRAVRVSMADLEALVRSWRDGADKRW
ncbi:MAG: helix-turn-helix domain-containing protein [Planctomycetes bacterium]|nr:helix-turn-helix domain-containing protein [Planctomycetota bacterium]